jgi:predicted small secreted protein
MTVQKRLVAGRLHIFRKAWYNNRIKILCFKEADMKNLNTAGLFVCLIAVCLLLTACNANKDVKEEILNQKMETSAEYANEPVVVALQGNSDKEKYNYGFRSEFKNGFSFVREQAVGDLQLGCSATSSYYLWPEIWTKEAVEKIAAEYRFGYKFINEDGAVIFDNLDAYLVAYTNPPTITEPGGEYYVVFYPSYFTDYGTAAVTRKGKFGIINTSGDIICDFIYDGIDIYYENIAVIKDDGMQKFYYIDSGQESSFSATYIHSLQDGFFSFYTYGATGEELTASGVVDSSGNMILPDYFLYTIEENDPFTEKNDEAVYVCPPDIYFNRNFEIIS